MPLVGEKKKRLRFNKFKSLPAISVRFGQTEEASDFVSVCLAEAQTGGKPSPSPNHFSYYVKRLQGERSTVDYLWQEKMFLFEHILCDLATGSLNCHLHLSCIHVLADVRHLHTSSLLAIMSSIRFVNQLPFRHIL